MNNSTVVVVDADALIAQTDPKDIHHQKAVEISNTLTNSNAKVLYPVTAVVEAATHMQRALSSTASAYSTAELMTDPSAQVAEVNQQTLTRALKYFSSKTSKKNTLFDCIVAAVAEENDADAVFSFDRFYKRQGFKLASEL